MERICSNKDCNILDNEMFMGKVDGKWYCKSCVEKARSNSSSGQIANQTNQIVQLQKENQEIKQILLRLERKVDQLQGQVNRLVNQQRQEQSQVQIQVPPKNFYKKN